MLMGHGESQSFRIPNINGGTSLPSPFDSQTLRLTYRPSVPGFIAAVGGAGGPVLGFGTPAPSPGAPYILQIERTSSTVAAFSVFQSNMTLIDSVALFFLSVPDRLFVSLVSSNTTASAPLPISRSANDAWISLVPS